MDRLIWSFWNVLMWTGAPFAHLVGKVIKMGDGSGNETKMVEQVIWSICLGAVVWILIPILSVWMWRHFSITVR